MQPHSLTPLIAICLVQCATVPAPRTDVPVCATGPVHTTEAPRVQATMNTVAAWTQALPPGEATRVLLTPEAITALNERNRLANRAAYQDVLDDAIADETRVTSEFAERLAWIDAKLDAGKYVEDVQGSYAAARARIDDSTPRDTLHVVVSEADIRCVPMDEGLFTQPRDVAFDRNRCSRLHLGEVIRVLREAEDGAWLYIHAGHSVGWLHNPALSPNVPRERTEAFRGIGPHAVITHDTMVGSRTLRMGRRFPLLASSPEDGWALEVPTAEGFERVVLPRNAPLHDGPMALTRANVWRLAMARLGEPYGWGGYKGGRDCSRLLLDLFSVFGLKFGRHSLVQANAGNAVIDMKAMAEGEKDAALRQAAKRGLVLVYMPGHIMLHLGESDGRPYALSSISEFVQPCATGDQVLRLDRVTVSDYDVGRGTERTSYIERINTLSIFGGP